MKKDTYRLITVRQAAELLGVAVSTARKWVAYRRLPGIVKLGHAVRLREDAILEFIERRTQKTNGRDAL